jgi:hypothetical protein
VLPPGVSTYISCCCFLQATEEYLEWFKAKLAEERELKAARAAAAAAKKVAEGEGGAEGGGEPGEAGAEGEEDGPVDAAEAAENAAFERVMGIVADRAPVAPKPAAAPAADAAVAASDFLSSLKDDAGAGHSRGGDRAGEGSRDDRWAGWMAAWASCVFGRDMIGTCIQQFEELLTGNA